MNRYRRWSVLALLGVVPVGCGGEATPERGDPIRDAPAEGFQGLSPEEIRARAESMSPAVAESLGIVDTTIHVEDRLSEDSLVAPPARADTSR